MSSKQHPGDTAISDEAVRRATGAGWADWFARLDASGAPKAGHKASAAWLAAEHEVSGWWSQMITVQYERERGLRAVGETTRGFSVSVQRSVAAEAAAVWDSLTAPSGLVALVGAVDPPALVVGAVVATTDGARYEVRTVRAPDRLRLRCERPDHPGATVVEVSIAARAARGATVRIMHDKLPDAAAREAMRAHWRAALKRLPL